MAADALVSVGVVVSGIVIQHTGWYMMDPLTGILIALLSSIPPGDYCAIVFVCRWTGASGISYDRIGQIISTTRGG